MTDAKVGYEVALRDFLDRAGIPVPAPRRTLAGTFHFWVGAPEENRAVAVFRWVEGQLLHNTPDPIEPARRLGEWIARIHLAGRTFRHDPPRVIDRAGLIRRSVDDLVWLCGDRADDAAFYARASVAVADALDRLDLQTMPFGPAMATSMRITPSSTRRGASP
ncbi:MAG: hypothetical protein EXQ85_06205 [Alphaproteobacteria bacterium]|nr:hypothetical protein [Alphaproteobacteria bacterium]